MVTPEALLGEEKWVPGRQEKFGETLHREIKKGGKRGGKWTGSIICQENFTKPEKGLDRRETQPYLLRWRGSRRYYNVGTSGAENGETERSRKLLVKGEDEPGGCANPSWNKS